ncbi:unnamed protein product, partial [Mesorhabditis spiculigera]
MDSASPTMEHPRDSPSVRTRLSRHEALLESSDDKYKKLVLRYNGLLEDKKRLMDLCHKNDALLDGLSAKVNELERQRQELVGICFSLITEQEKLLADNDIIDRLTSELKRINEERGLLDASRKSNDFYDDYMRLTRATTLHEQRATMSSTGTPSISSSTKKPSTLRKMTDRTQRSRSRSPNERRGITSVFSPQTKQSVIEWVRGAYNNEAYQELGFLHVAMIYISFAVMIMFAHFSVFFRKHKLIDAKEMLMAKERPEQEDFTPLENGFDQMLVNDVYRKSTDIINRPIVGVPGALVRLKDRITKNFGWTYEYTGTETEVINMGSYNYLGFAHNDGPCAEAAAEYIDNFGLHVGAPRDEAVVMQAQRDLEECVANYLGVEDAICFPMGFVTNSMNIAALVNKNSLVLSDQLNHASLVLGCRMSGATVVVFKHNNAHDCGEKLRDAICQPNPRTGKKFKKIMIVCEGIYSMEGTILDLPAFIAVKKKYRAYLFLDEAHSVGALGPTGRGIVEYWGADPKDVDLMMGTLTKSFAAAGGYIGGKKETIAHLRIHSAGSCYGSPMSPPIIAQVLSSMKIMLGEDGTDIGQKKVVALRRNSRYFRAKLKALGFLVYGHDDSPVVPLMTFHTTKVVYWGRETLRYGIGAVQVGYPATALTKARVRFCISADHTKEQLDYVLAICDKIGDLSNTKYAFDPSKNFDSIEY